MQSRMMAQCWPIRYFPPGLWHTQKMLGLMPGSQLGDHSSAYSSVACAYFPAWLICFLFFIGASPATLAAPPKLSYVGSLGGASGPVTTKGSIAFYCEGPHLAVLDLSNPATPRLLSRTKLPSLARSVSITGSRAYLALGDTGVALLDISDLSLPRIISTYDTPGSANDAISSGTRTYVADSDAIVVLDISRPSSPTLLGRCPVKEAVANRIELCGSCLLTAAKSQFLVIDISDSKKPFVKAMLSVPAWDLAIRGSTAYAIINGMFENHSLAAIDVSDPRNPTLGATTPVRWGIASGLALRGSQVLVAARALPGSELAVYDIKSPLHPILSSAVRLPGETDGAKGIALAGSNAIVPGSMYGLCVIDIESSPGPALIGAYEIPHDPVHVEWNGERLYVASSVTAGTVRIGFQAIDASRPDQPVVVGSWREDNVSDFDVSGQHLYAVSSSSGGGGKFRVFDISTSISLISTIPINHDPKDILVEDKWGYVAYWEQKSNIIASGLLVYDLSNPVAPIPSGSVDWQGSEEANHVRVFGSRAFLTVWPRKFTVCDVSNRMIPIIIGNFLNESTWTDSCDLLVRNNLAYFSVGRDGMKMVDIANPASPILKSAFMPPGYANRMEFMDGERWLALTNDRGGYLQKGSGILMYDLENPHTPQLRASYDTIGYADDLAIRDSQISVADRRGGLILLRFDSGGATAAEPSLWRSYR